MHCAGRYTVNQVRKGKIIKSLTSKNIVVNGGIDHMMNLFFDISGDTLVSFTYLGLYTNNYVPGPTDSEANFYTSSYASETTAYSESTRQQFKINSGFTTSVTNTTFPAVFNFTGTATVRGIFLDTVSTKNGSFGKLISASLLPDTLTTANLDQIVVYYTFTLTTS